ncbi:MAG: hypothetical protein ACP6IS_07255 [Candidatus Asgardarchaeia archaeon]
MRLFKTIQVTSRKIKIRRTSYEVNISYFKKWFFRPKYTLSVFRGTSLIGSKTLKEPILEFLIAAVHQLTSVRLDDSLVADAIGEALTDLKKRIEEAKKTK